ncbi:hypothetical protein [Sinomonas susongensis]|nr:hypothetical protein [Sinomonas susongensis]
MTAFLILAMLAALFLGAGLLALLPSLPLVRDLICMPWDEEGTNA